MRINGETHYLWRAVDHEGEVLEVYASKRRDRKAALKFLKRAMKRYGRPGTIVTVLIKMIVDRSVNGGEFLQSLDVPEFRHRTFSSSKRLL